MTQSASCPDCGSTNLSERGTSKRPGELLLVCANGHRFQGRMSYGYLHIYRSGPRNPVGYVVRSVRLTPEQATWYDELANGSEIIRLAIDNYRGRL